MKKILVLLFFTVLSFQTPLVNAFELEDFNGSPINLDDKIGKGKWTLVMFWAHDCGVCRAEFPAISKFHSDRKDVDVVGISIDGDTNKHLAQSFLDSNPASFPSYITSLSLVSFNYQALTEEDFRGTPTFLLFTPDGELLGNNPGKLSVTALEKFINDNS